MAHNGPGAVGRCVVPGERELRPGDPRRPGSRGPRASQSAFRQCWPRPPWRALMGPAILLDSAPSHHGAPALALSLPPLPGGPPMPPAALLALPPHQAPAPGPTSGQPAWAMNSTRPFSFPNIKCLLSIRGVWGNGNYRIGECPWVKKYVECRNLAGPLIRAGVIPAVI